MNNLLSKLKEAVVSVLPIAVIVLLTAIFAADVEGDAIWRFVIGAVFVIIGMSLFTLGADVAMLEIGNRVGGSLTKTRKLPIIIILALFIGIIITIAEPDLMVLADQLSSVVNKYVLIAAVGIGVGVFLVVAVLRIIFQIPLRRLLIVFYVGMFVLAIFVPKEFLATAFDSGGVTTGPMTVPFIMALGVGIAATVGKNNTEDSFGLVALCSIGPILSVLFVGLFVDTSSITVTSAASATENGVFRAFFVAMPSYMLEVGIALSPIAVFFFVYNAVALKVSKRTVGRIVIGLLYVYIGLVVFLTAVNVGFSPMGKMLGGSLVSKGFGWIIIPIGVVMGFFIVAAEPAVHVLNGQVEELSNGAIKKKHMMISLMLGVGAAVGLAMVRVVTGISLWWLIVPGYALALGLSFFVPKMFTAIAFDSGGVASGPMTATFLLPFAMGACSARGGNVLTDAFGVVAMVAMTPLLTIQLLGLVSVLKNKRAHKLSVVETAPTSIEQSILVPEEEDAVVEFLKTEEQTNVALFDDDETIFFDEPAKKPIVVQAVIAENKPIEDKPAQVEQAAATVDEQSNDNPRNEQNADSSDEI